MEVVFERVAGLDVGKASVTVCLRTPPSEGGDRRRTPRRESETPTFKTTAPVLRVAEWLVACRVTIAVTGVDLDGYWRSVFYASEERDASAGCSTPRI
jgi:transposase